MPEHRLICPISKNSSPDAHCKNTGLELIAQDGSIVAAALAAEFINWELCLVIGAVISRIARAAGIHACQLFRWRKELCWVEEPLMQV